MRTLQKGQALLIVLLIMTVTLTVVLSIVSRSVTDLSVTTLEEDALRAFSAAEAGIEESLLSGTGTGLATPVDPKEPGVNYVTDVTTDPEGTSFIYPDLLLSGDSATFWFVQHDSAGILDCSGGCSRATNLRVCWGNTGTPANIGPAIEVSIYYDPVNPPRSIAKPNDFTNLRVYRQAFDPNGGRTGTNNFAGANVGVCPFGGSFAFNTTINLASALGGPCTNSAGCLLMARVRMFYNNSTPHALGVGLNGGPNQNLPAQGIRIDSLGVAGESTRRVNVFQGYPAPPPIFDTAVFSGGDFSK